MENHDMRYMQEQADKEQQKEALEIAKYEEHNNQKRFDFVALDRKVLIVAVEGSVNDWTAYCGAVKGNNHSLEAREVARSGTKISKEIAELLFPTFRNLEWRY